MIHQEKIQVTVNIIVEKSSLCSKPAKIKSHTWCFILVIRNTIRILSFTDQELVPALQRFIITNAAHINIKPSIVVDVNHRNTRTPSTVLRDPGFFCNIFKPHSAPIQIDFIFSLVGRKEYITESIIIKITNANAGTVIKIHVLKHVELRSRCEPVCKINSCCPAIKCFKQYRLFFLLIIAREKE